MSSPSELPAIVVVAFNRPQSLERILDSIARADYEGYEGVPLVISIDYSGHTQVSEIAEKFVWNYGPKEIIQHPENIGLRKHILSCGDLSDQYGSVIVLEDDLFVSTAFYDYACQAMKFYANDQVVSGISLYAYDHNEYAQVRFTPLEDGYDNYFFQSASSWGQLWTRNQWRSFKTWYQANGHLSITPEDPLPSQILSWPASSWKKYFIKYMALENKYFVFPRISLTTNFRDVGTNFRYTNSNYQVPLLLGRRKYNFCRLEESGAVYDNHFEIEARCLKHYNKELEKFNFECDFYGTKSPKKVKSEYLLTSRDCIDSVASYALTQVPQELNVAFNIRGSFFHLAKATDCRVLKQEKRTLQFRRLHKDLGVKRNGIMFLHDLLDTISRKVKALTSTAHSGI